MKPSITPGAERVVSTGALTAPLFGEHLGRDFALHGPAALRAARSRRIRSALAARSASSSGLVDDGFIEE